jgi:hypothetical protein
MCFLANFVRCATLVVALLGAAAPGTAEEDDRWRKLPPLPGRADGVSDIALEGNTLWAMAGNTVAYWDDSQWRLPAGDKLKAGMYLATFKGGGARPLYCTQPGAGPPSGVLYQLSDGAARQVAEFQYDVPHDYPGLEVAQSGQVINWRR